MCVHQTFKTFKSFDEHLVCWCSGHTISLCWNVKSLRLVRGPLNLIILMSNDIGKSASDRYCYLLYKFVLCVLFIQTDELFCYQGGE